MVPHGMTGNVLGISRIALLASGLLLGGMPGEGAAVEPSRPQPPPGRTATVNPTTPGSSGVIVAGGKLSVSLREARFQDVMEAIGEQSGIEISIVGEVGQTTLTESFSGLPLEEGLISLLRDKNFAFAYSDVEGERQVTRVVVTPRRSGQPVLAPPPTTVPLPESTRSTLDTLGAMPVEPPIPPSPGVVAPSSSPAPMQGQIPPVGNPTVSPTPSGVPR